jgi:hypothetical protein
MTTPMLMPIAAMNQIDAPTETGDGDRRAGKSQVDDDAGGHP